MISAFGVEHEYVSKAMSPATIKDRRKRAASSVAGYTALGGASYAGTRGLQHRSEAKDERWMQRDNLRDSDRHLTRATKLETEAARAKNAGMDSELRSMHYDRDTPGHLLTNTQARLHYARADIHAQNAGISRTMARHHKKWAANAGKAADVARARSAKNFKVAGGLAVASAAGLGYAHRPKKNISKGGVTQAYRLGRYSRDAEKAAKGATKYNLKNGASEIDTRRHYRDWKIAHENSMGQMNDLMNRRQRVAYSAGRNRRKLGMISTAAVGGGATGATMRQRAKKTATTTLKVQQ